MGVNWKFVFILSHQGSFRHITARFCSSLLVLAQYDSTFFFFSLLPYGAMPSPLKERVRRCCFCSYLARIVFSPLDGLQETVFSSRFFFLFFNLGPVSPEEGQVFSYFVLVFVSFEEFSYIFWPKEVSSAASSGSFSGLSIVWDCWECCYSVDPKVSISSL